MKKWRITVYREWKEYGYVELEAESEFEAQESGRDALADDALIEWQGDRMEPGDQDVLDVERIEED